MGKKTSIWLIIAAFLVLAGGLLFGGVMTMLQWDFGKLATDKYETQEYILEESFENITVVTDTSDVIFLPSQDGKTTVVCHQQSKVRHTVAVQDDTLSIRVEDSRKWYERIGIHFGAPKITVYLPQSSYGALSLRSSTGDIEIPEDFRFETMEITESTGHVTSYASASGAVTIRTSTGNIRVENITAGSMELTVTTGNIRVIQVACQGDLQIRVSTGKTHLDRVTCQNLLSTGDTGDITLQDVTAEEKATIERSTGHVNFTRFDAGQIEITTDTGDVRGSLLSEKIFLVKTDTGKTNVPQTVSGGTCRITTDTGDIIISVVS